MNIPSLVLRLSLLSVRLLQWASAVIVMGIASYLISKFSNNRGLLVYHEVIAVLSVAFFLPGLVSPFFPRLAVASLPIDLVFSYLWVTSFIIMTLDYTEGSCFLTAPPGGGCALKHAMQAFAFLAFFCSLCSAILEVWNLWVYRKDHTGNSHHTKEVNRRSGDTGVTGTTVGTDGGAETAGAAPATTGV